MSVYIVPSVNTIAVVGVWAGRLKRFLRLLISICSIYMLEQIRPPESLHNHLFPTRNRLGMGKAGVTAFFVSHELFLYISTLILTLFDFVWV